MPIIPDLKGQKQGYWAGLTLQWMVSVLGYPYQWGAAGPGKFDCSGLIWWAYRTAHVPQTPSVRWTTATMIMAGDKVAIGSEKPGDWVFPHRGHVGVCIGHGLYINAPTAGENVKIAKYGKLYAVRRRVPPMSVEDADNLTQGGKRTEGLPRNPDGSPDLGDEGRAEASSFVETGIAAITDSLEEILGVFTAFGAAVEWLADGHNWYRVGLFSLGSVSLFIGIKQVM